MVEIHYGSIEPSKKLYSKIGTGASYTLDEVIAELIDNAIDARTEIQLRKNNPDKLIVEVDITKDFIEVRDNAKGMNGKTAVSALMLGESTDSARKLSGFGLGLKTGSLSVGDTFGVITGIEGSDERNKVQFNIQKWETDTRLGFDKPYPYEVVKKPVGEHGTKIVITDLRVNITPSKIDKIKVELGNRYRAYFRNNEIIIYVNGKIVEPEKVDWAYGYPVYLDIDSPYGKITGSIGIMKHMSYSKGWGFDLFRNNRLIMQSQKFGITDHPSYALVKGELNLDFVPVNQTKNKFITESKEWEDAIKYAKQNELFTKVIKEAVDLKWNPVAKVSKKVQKQVDTMLENLARVLNRKYKEEFKPNATIPISGQGNKITEVMVEQRESPSEHGGSREPGDGTRKRIPKKYHKVLKFKQASGRVFVVEHELNATPGGPRKSLVEEKHRVVVYTNTEYPAFKQVSEFTKPFYIIENVIDAIAERRAMDNGYSVNKFTTEKDEFMASIFVGKDTVEEVM